MNRLAAIIGPAWPAGADRTFRPGGGPICDESLPLLFAGFRFTADVVAPAEPAGALFALGDWNGSFALFVADGRLAFVFSRAGELLEMTADRPLPPGPQTLGVTCTLGPGVGGTLRLWHGDVTVGVLDFDGRIPGALQHGGAGLRLGFDTGLPVSPRYAAPAAWNGQLTSVRMQAPGPALPDPGDEIGAALHAD